MPKTETAELREAYEAYSYGIEIDKIETTEDVKNALKAYVMHKGKSAYQIARLTGIKSEVFYRLKLIDRTYKKQQRTLHHSGIWLALRQVIEGEYNTLGQCGASDIEIKQAIGILDMLESGHSSYDISSTLNIPRWEINRIFSRLHDCYYLNDLSGEIPRIVV